MRNDSQIDGLFKGSTFPIRRYLWYVEPNGANPRPTKQYAAELGLPILGQEDKPTPAPPGDFDWGDYLEQALEFLVYGFSYFEITGMYDDQTNIWHIDDICPRPQETITAFSIDPRGTLNAIYQSETEIPANRLVPNVWQKQGANWVGRSMMRACYQDWLMKDKLLRIDVIRHARNGMGIPIVELSEGATDKQIKMASALAQQYQVGDASGGALPAGMQLKLVGVSGQTSDPLASIRYHDEAMARNFMQMFVQLGATRTGSRALGQTFVSWFNQSQETIAWEIADTFNQYVTRRWMDWNYGTSAPAPRLAFKRHESEALSIADLAVLVQEGVIQPGSELYSYLSTRFALPPGAQGTGTPTGVGPTPRPDWTQTPPAD
jgi:hypothetical protein